VQDTELFYTSSITATCEFTVTPNHLCKQKKLLKKVSYFQMTIGGAAPNQPDFPLRGQEPEAHTSRVGLAHAAQRLPLVLSE
jgi:hypothetical protein